jgi:hypothetical protein
MSETLKKKKKVKEKEIGQEDETDNLLPLPGNDFGFYLLLSFRSYSPTPQSCFLHLSHWKSLHRQVGIVTSLH